MDSPSAESVAEPLVGLGEDPVERHVVAVGIDAERVERDGRGLAAQHTALQGLRPRGAVGLRRDHGHAHDRGVGERGRACGVDGVLHPVVARLLRGEVAQHSPDAKASASFVDDVTDEGSRMIALPDVATSLSRTGMSTWAPARTTTESSTAIGARSGVGGRR